MRLAAPAFGPFAMAFVRVTVAAAVLGLAMIVLRKQILRGSQFYWTLGIGVLNSGIPFALFGYATLHLPAGYSAVLNATVPFWGLAIGAVVFHERLPVYKLLALSCAVAGLGIMLSLGSVDLNVRTVSAAAACLLATLLYAIVGNITQRKLLGADPVAQSFGAMLGGSIALLPFALWQWPAINPSAGDWAAVLTLGVLCSAIAYILYFWLIVNAGLTYSMNVTLVIPVFGVLWGMVFLGETLTVLSTLGAVITVLSTAVVIGVLPKRWFVRA